MRSAIIAAGMIIAMGLCPMLIYGRNAPLILAFFVIAVFSDILELVLRKKR
jgi:hypothetical protein